MAHSPHRHRRRTASGAGAAAAVFLALVLGACAAPAPSIGQSASALQQQWGAPTGRHALPQGGERLEYASGPWGRTTWMVDVDAAGRVAARSQVLNEAHFADFMGRAPGLSREAVLRELGRPGERKHGGRMGGEVWSWRYPTNDCLWFQVSVADDGRATSAGYGTDPTCDGPNDRQ